jgi:hypothetical protein
MNDQTPQFSVEEVESATPAPRARVSDIAAPPVESPADKLERKKDYLEGFLAMQPTGLAGHEPGGELYESVIGALKEIFDPEIPVNIYDLGLIYGVEITPEGSASVSMTLTTPHCPVAESMPGEVEMSDEARLELGML